MPSPLLYLESLKQLEGEQLRYQLRERLRWLWPGPRASRAPAALRERRGWGTRVPRWRPPVTLGVLDGEFTFWGRTARLDLHRPWIEPRLGRSWNYPVHYFEYAPPIADLASASSDTALQTALRDMIDAWIEVHPPGEGLAWDPYPTALRIVSWMDVMQVLGDRAPEDWRRRVLASLYVQASWLCGRLERHLLGTHLLKDLKALVLAGRLFDDAAAAAWHCDALVLLERELAQQLSADGGHLEPSVMYHCVALEDLLDLLNFEAALPDALRLDLERSASRMLEFAATTQAPDGNYPLLGDASHGSAPSPAELIQYAVRLGLRPPAVASGWRLLASTGLAVWRDARQVLIADVGTIGPPHLAAHGHCDSLSFEWHIDGVPFIVDSGTRTYEPGPDRLACRSTRAHNTLEIDGREQHEIWGAFRVARRAAVRARTDGESAVEAELVPWHDRSILVRRRFEATPQFIRILDSVEGSARHSVCSRVHLHPDCDAQLEGRLLRLRHGVASASILLPESPRFELLDPSRSGAWHASHFGVARATSMLVASHEGALPFDCVLELRIQ